MAGHAPLYKRVHWRRIKTILSSIAEYEKINLNNYNINKIVCYECFGDDLKGKTVKTNIPR